MFPWFFPMIFRYFPMKDLGISQLSIDFQFFFGISQGLFFFGDWLDWVYTVYRVEFYDVYTVYTVYSIVWCEVQLLSEPQIIPRLPYHWRQGPQTSRRSRGSLFMTPFLAALPRGSAFTVVLPGRLAWFENKKQLSSLSYNTASINYKAVHAALMRMALKSENLKKSESLCKSRTRRLQVAVGQKHIYVTAHDAGCIHEEAACFNHSRTNHRFKAGFFLGAVPVVSGYIKFTYIYIHEYP